MRRGRGTMTSRERLGGPTCTASRVFTEMTLLPPIFLFTSFPLLLTELSRNGQQRVLRTPNKRGIQRREAGNNFRDEKSV